jgi:hypothetical protein
MSTPPSAPGPILGATPQSKGSGRHRDHASKHTQKDYAPYLQEDLLHERTHQENLSQEFSRIFVKNCSEYLDFLE